MIVGNKSKYRIGVNMHLAVKIQRPTFNFKIELFDTKK